MSTAASEERSMQLVLKPRSSQARCHECGSPVVQSVCCGCHRLMCDEHKRVLIPLSLRRTVAAVLPVGWRQVRTVHTPATSKRHYCKDCMRAVQSYTPELVAASLTAVIGAVVAISSLVIGAVLIVIGAVRIVRAYVVFRRARDAEASDARLDMHLSPQISAVSLVETLSGTATLGKDTYDTEISSVQGELSVKAAWSRANWDQVRRYRDRYEVADEDDVFFSAGAIVLKGPMGLTFRETGSCEVSGSTAILLRGRTSEHPVLQTVGGHGDGRWLISLDYDITPPEDDGWLMPIWLTPAIVPESDQRSLDLELQWMKYGPTEDGMELDMVELLRVFVPVDWGDVQSLSESGSVGISPPDKALGEHLRKIEWSHLSVKQASRGRYRLSIKFEHGIDAKDFITGRLEVRFKGALSGVERVDLYGPDGASRRERPKRKLNTLVNVDFKLSLAAVRYQDVRVVPDQARPDDRTRTKQNKQNKFDHVVPDHKTVAMLTDHLSDEGYYVKRVIENPPQTGKRAEVVNRYWDIAGRKYNGVYPIDFHLILTGEEVHDGHLVRTGTTATSLWVQGTYATPEMEQRVVDEWD
jgi:hypothetical protein